MRKNEVFIGSALSFNSDISKTAQDKLPISMEEEETEILQGQLIR